MRRTATFALLAVLLAPSCGAIAIRSAILQADPQNARVRALLSSDHEKFAALQRQPQPAS
jgi:hypothetical protein